jgi:hypothetical protein
MLDIGVRRLISQKLVEPHFTKPDEVVRWMGAMQAQDFLGSMWAIGCRMQMSTEEWIERAITERTILRTWPMRGTIHFVLAEDVRWMVDLMAPRVIRRNQGAYRKAGLDEEVFARSRNIFVQALEGGQQLTRSALYAVLEAEGISTENSRGLYIIGRLAQEGLICFGSREGKQPTIALLDEWSPDQRKLTREEGLAEITLRYFQSHGPATIQDFMWWSGLLAVDAQAGLEAVKPQLAGDTITGKPYWWVESNAPMSSPSLHLLPAYDEFMVSYKDRSASLDPQFDWLSAPEEYLGYIVVIDGQVAGTWRRTFKDGAVVIESKFARPLTSTESERFEVAIQRYGEFLNMPVSIIS